MRARDVVRLLARGGRTAVVTAPGGHFYTVASARRFRLDHPWLGRIMQVFPVDRPLPELVEGLNRFNPASVAGFLSMLTQLAAEREAGRLRIRPATPRPNAPSSVSAARTAGTTSTATGSWSSRSTPATGRSRRGSRRTPS
jgi:phenylacetate-CoA ligase